MMKKTKIPWRTRLKLWQENCKKTFFAWYAKEGIEICPVCGVCPFEFDEEFKKIEAEGVKRVLKVFQNEVRKHERKIKGLIVRNSNDAYVFEYHKNRHEEAVKAVQLIVYLFNLKK